MPPRDPGPHLVKRGSLKDFRQESDMVNPTAVEKIDSGEVGRTSVLSEKQ